MSILSQWAYSKIILFLFYEKLRWWGGGGNTVPELLCLLSMCINRRFPVMFWYMIIKRKTFPKIWQLSCLRMDLSLVLYCKLKYIFCEYTFIQCFPAFFFSSFVKEIWTTEGWKITFYRETGSRNNISTGFNVSKNRQEMSMNGAIEKWDIFKERLLMNCYSLKELSWGIAKIFKLKFFNFD
jgi:hypothetical protein